MQMTPIEDTKISFFILHMWSRDGLSSLRTIPMEAGIARISVVICTESLVVSTGLYWAEVMEWLMAQLAQYQFVTVSLSSG